MTVSDFGGSALGWLGGSSRPQWRRQVRAIRPWTRPLSWALIWGSAVLAGCTWDEAGGDAQVRSTQSNTSNGAQTPLVAGALPQRTVGAMTLESVPPLPADLTARLNAYQNVRTARFSAWLPPASGSDEHRMIVATRFGETRQLHVVDEPGAARRQITFFAEPVGGASVRPPAWDAGASTSAFIFRKDVAGSESYQLFYYDSTTGKAQMLTDGTSRNGGAMWSPDGSQVVFYSTKRNGKDWDLYVADVPPPEAMRDGTAVPLDARPVLTQPGVWTAEDWSFDSKLLLVSRYVSVNEGQLYVLRVATGELTEILPPAQREGQKVAIGAAEFTGDASGVFFTSDYGSDFTRLLYTELAGNQPVGPIRPLSADIRWNVTSFVLSDDEQYYAFVTNEDGYGRLVVRRRQDHTFVAMPLLPQGLVGGLEFSPDSRHLGLTLSSPTRQSDAYSIDLKARKLVRWTHSEGGGLNPEQLVEPRLIAVQSFDGERVPAFVFEPRTPAPDGRGWPVLISIHGGPEGQARPGFNSFRQLLINELGIAVVVPNVRGSAGYGKRYLQLDNGMLREDSVRDIGAVLDWIGEQPQFDTSRVGVMGGSYGGYMTLASLIRFGDRLKVGVESVGISNFVTFLQNTRDYRRDLRRQEYGDERDPAMRAFLQQISPLTQAHKLTQPLLVAQGKNDPRVPVTESRQMVTTARANGTTVWYLEAANEGHGFRQKQNRDIYRVAVALFLQKYLL